MTTGNHHDNSRDDEREHEQSLDALARAWQSTHREEPPADVDLAVLREARAAVGKKSARAWPWTRSWTGWLSTGAVAAVAITVLINLQDEAPAPVKLPPAAPPPAPVTATPRASRDTAGEDRARASEETQLAPVEARRKAEPAENISMFKTEPMADAIMEERAEAADAAPEREMEQVVLPPAEWLERIVGMQAEGDPGWQEELARFRARWPDYPLPAGLAEAAEDSGS